MRRRLLFLAPTIILVTALATGADRLAEAAIPVATRTPSVPTKQQALAAYAKLPLAFAPNAGQHDRRVRYAAQAGNRASSSRGRESCSCSGRARLDSRFTSASSALTRAPRSRAPDGVQARSTT